MPSTPATRRRLAALTLLVLLGALALWAARPVPSEGQDAGTLRQQVESGREAERSLSSAAARLEALEARAARSVALMEARLAEAQAAANAWESRLAQTRADLRRTRARVVRLRARLARDRADLADALRARYMVAEPDLVSVVLASQNFADLVDRAAFYKRMDRRNRSVVRAVRRARDAMRRESARLAGLVPRQERQTAEAQRERDALAQQSAALEARRATLARARAARQAALSRAVSSRRRAERELRRLEREQQQAAVDKRGPGGPWAIPWAIVQCESGGQNLPPNYAGASGYYQFIPSTWRGMGGSTPHAYLASKAEQDRLAAKLWNGGRGASNWDCAAIVGIL
jgi:peptidoglycan hydrolase CwlO-like protein